MGDEIVIKYGLIHYKKVTDEDGVEHFEPILPEVPKKRKPEENSDSSKNLSSDAERLRSLKANIKYNRSRLSNNTT